MKKLITLTVFALTIINGICFDNGSYWINNNTEAHVISQNGTSVTNNLVSGKTYTVGQELTEMVTTNKSLLYLSGGTLVDISTNSTFTINMFDQEILNLYSQPVKAEFGSFNLSITFTKGEFVVIYPDNTNSTFTINTPYNTYEIVPGKYYFRISERSAIAYVYEGSMQVHGDKRVDKTEKGKLAMAIPFTDPDSGIPDKIITSIKTFASTTETERFVTPILKAIKQIHDVQFFVIDGKTVGIKMK